VEAVIRLTAEKDQLYISYNRTDEDELAHPPRGRIGIHLRTPTTCGGFLQLNPHNTIECTGCSLRIYLPTTIVTFGDLRTHMEEQFP